MLSIRLVFGILAGLGCFAVNQAANATAQDKRELAFYSGRATTAQIELQLAQSLVPATYLQLLIEQQPSWPYWNENFDRVAAKLLTMVPNGTIWNLQLQPFGQSRGFYPLRPEDVPFVGTDIIKNDQTNFDPNRPRRTYPTIQTRQTRINVFYAVQGFYAAFVRVPVFIRGTSVDENFGYNFAGANFSTLDGYSLNMSYPPVPFPAGPPATGYPLGYATMCPICYNPPNLTASPPIPSSRYWGGIVSMINFQAVSSGSDSRLATLESEGYKYRLTKPLSGGAIDTIVEKGGSVNLGNAVSVPVRVPSEVWTLYLEPLGNGSWYPSWRLPLFGAVIVISFVIGLLVFMALWFYCRQRTQLDLLKVVIKALEDSTQAQLQVSSQLAQEVEKSDKLLSRMLPPFAAEKLRKGEAVEAEDYPSVSILFTDIVSFTEISARCTPRQVCQMLDQVYLAFDSILKSYTELFKVETIGDAYMVVANLSRECLDHADQMILFGLQIQDATANMVAPDGTPLKIRLGINTGHVVGGVVGSEMPHFCLFGNTVNTASRMESHGLPCRVHISQACFDAIVDKDRFVIEDRGMIEVKGKGQMHTYLVAGAHHSSTNAQMASIRLPDMSHLSASVGLDSPTNEGFGFRYPYGMRSGLGSTDALHVPLETVEDLEDAFMNDLASCPIEIKKSVLREVRSMNGVESSCLPSNVDLSAGNRASMSLKSGIIGSFENQCEM